MTGFLKKGATRVADLVWPPLCLVCDTPVGAASTLCSACWGRVSFIAAPLCACCGMPFDIPVEAGTLCGACLAQPPRFQAARAAMVYDDASRALVLGFKHADRTHMAQALAAWMYRAGGEILAQADGVVPVPLHRGRLFHRRYNQAALLAQGLGRLAAKPVAVDLLRRVRATPSQGHLSRAQRQENVRGAFVVSAGQAAWLKGKTIVVVDDVMTTGATVEECARVLLAAGASAVRGVTLARVKGVV